MSWISPDLLSLLVKVSYLVAAALFLLADRIAAQRGGDGFQPAPPVAQPAGLGAMFVIGAASAAGVFCTTSRMAHSVGDVRYLGLQS